MSAGKLVLRRGKSRIIHARGMLRLQALGKDDLGDAVWQDEDVNTDDLGFGILHGYGGGIYGKPVNESDPPNGSKHLVLAAGPYRFAFESVAFPAGRAWDQRHGHVRIVQTYDDPLFGTMHVEVFDPAMRANAMLWLVATRNGVDVASVIADGVAK